MIELSVGLPMFRSESIGHLALESLARQKDVDFGWELLIMEEADGCFGEQKLKEYAERLREAGCKRLEYWQIESWIPLAFKWKYLGSNCSPTSESFLLQAADCYSQPYRLRETYDLFKEDPEVDWVQSPLGYFYDIASETVALFDQDSYEKITWDGSASKHPCALNMAMRARYARGLPAEPVKSSVDSWLYNICTSLKGSPLIVNSNNSDNYSRGVDVHGMNKISIHRGNRIAEFTPPFEKTEMALDDLVPEDIADFIRQHKDKVASNITIYHELGGLR
jgi:hypothetical protein